MSSVTRLATRGLGRPIWPVTQWLLEPGDSSPAQGRPAGVDERLRRRIWIVVCCLLLTVLALLTRPGRIIADTKLDMAINPGEFLDRALHLWDPAQFGQLQDQVAGYFFPMGPFFWLGHAAALQPWVVQRLWLAAVLIAAFVGTTRVAARLGVGTPMTQIVAGLGYAMCPRGLGLLGQLSSEFLPAAMLPWILLPLITAVQGGNRLRAALRSGVAVALASGLNATATFAVLLPPLIYLLCARRPAPRWRILGWWVVAVSMATVWWAVPLALLGKYGFSFLPYTESATITTGVTSLTNTFRGTEDWVNYIIAHGQPWWPVGYKLTVEIPLIMLTGLVAGLGLAGLVRRGLPERRFLLWTLLLGLLVISAGYASRFGNPLAEPVRHLLDGPLAPMRNVRKFDPMIRLPIAVGLAHMLAPLRYPRLRVAVSALTAFAVAGVALPAFTNGLSSSGDFQRIPAYWVNATRWLNQHAGNQTVLVVPGARFGEYLWGRPLDDVMEPLSTARWASRSVVPQGSVALTRLLDAVDTRLTDGQGSAGLAPVLASMGVKYVLVRNDLIRSDLDGAWPSRVLQAVNSSPGLRLVAQFWDRTHPFAGSVEPDDATTAFDPLYRPLLVYQVSGAQDVATVLPTDQTLRVYGAPETLLTLADAGLLANRPVLLNSDAPSIATGQSVVSDSLRRRVVGFGEPRIVRSATLTEHDPATTVWAADDYLEPSWRRYLTVSGYDGIENVTASSSASGINGIPAQDATGYLPFAAIDGDYRTEWKSGGLTGPAGQWIRIDFLHQLSPPAVKVAFVVDPVIGPPVSRVAVQTAAGQIVQPVAQTDKAQTVRVPAGQTTWLRIKIVGLAYAPHPKLGSQVAISEITVAGISASRTIRLPDVAAPSGQDPTATVVTRSEMPASDCMPALSRWVCSPQLTRPVEEEFGFNHTFFAQTPHRAQLYGSVTVTDPAIIDAYARGTATAPNVKASSTWMNAPQQLPRAAFDGDPLTAWIAAPTDRRPSLTISWTGRRTISQIMITRPPGAAAPAQVFVTGTAPNQLGGGWIAAAKTTMHFRPMRTDRITLAFSPLQLPLQITEVTIPGVQRRKDNAQAPLTIPCGAGPRIKLDGAAAATTVSGTRSELLSGQPMQFAVCGPVRVAAGANTLVEPANDAFRIDTAVVDRLGSSSLAATSAANQSPWARPVAQFTSAVPMAHEPWAGQPMAGGAAPALLGRPSRASLPGEPPAAAKPAYRPGAPSEATATVKTWTAADRILLVAASQQSYLVVNENFNAGWQARSGKAVLRPVRIDGWKQGWIVPAGTYAEVRLTYLPDPTYRLALFCGLAVLAALLLLALALARPERLTPLPAPPQAEYRRRSLVGRLLWILPVSAAAGAWLAGYSGAIILPVTTVFFLTALLHTRTSRFAWQIARPWLICGLMVIASAAAAVGEHLHLADYQGLALNLLWDALPQLLCLLIVARLLADLGLGRLIGAERAGTLRGQALRPLPPGPGVARGDPGLPRLPAAGPPGTRWAPAPLTAPGVPDAQTPPHPLSPHPLSPYPRTQPGLPGMSGPQDPWGEQPTWSGAWDTTGRSGPDGWHRRDPSRPDPSRPDRPDPRRQNPGGQNPRSQNPRGRDPRDPDPRGQNPRGRDPWRRNHGGKDHGGRG